MASALAIGTGVAVAAFLVSPLPSFKFPEANMQEIRVAQDSSHGGDLGEASERWARHSTKAASSRG